MEFPGAFEVHVPEEAPANEVEVHNSAEAAAAARLVDEGHLVRLWKLPAAPGDTNALGRTAPTPKRSSTLCCALCRSTTGCRSRSPHSSPIPTIPHLSRPCPRNREESPMSGDHLLEPGLTRAAARRPRSAKLWISANDRRTTAASCP